MVDGNCRDDEQVGALGSGIERTSQERDDTGAMPAFFVHQYQRRIRRQSAQRGGTHHGCFVVDPVALHVVRERGGPELQIVEVRGALVDKVVTGNHVDRNRKILHMGALAPGTYNYDFFQHGLGGPALIIGSFLGAGPLGCEHRQRQRQSAGNLPHTVLHGIAPAWFSR